MLHWSTNPALLQPRILARKNGFLFDHFQSQRPHHQGSRTTPDDRLPTKIRRTEHDMRFTGASVG
jgi:hypothetical protein